MCALVLDSNPKSGTLEKLPLFCLGALCPPLGCLTPNRNALGIAELWAKYAVQTLPLTN